MKNNYNSLDNGMVTLFKKGIGVSEGSPPNSRSVVTRPSWLVLFLMFLAMTIGQSAKAQTYFTESFENPWYLNGDGVTAAATAGPNAPTGWNQIRVTNAVVPVACTGGAHDWGQSTWSSGTTWSSTSSYPTGCAPYGGAPSQPPAGTKALWFYDGNTNGSSTRIISSPAINLASATTPVLSFGYSYAGGAVVTVVGSLDGGTTWNVLNTISATSSGSWVTKVVPIPASYKIATAKIGFQIVSSYGSYDCFIDNVTVREGVAGTSTSIGGLWSSPATWVGGIIPETTAVIASGAIVTVDQVVSVGSLTVNGTLQWNATANAMTIAGNLTINSGGVFLPYSSAQTGVTVNIGGNLQNDGYANLALASTLINFNGSGSTLSGSGTFQGDGTNGIIRSLFFQNTGSNSVSTSQNIIVTSGLGLTAGSLNTNGKLRVDNTAQVYGQALNFQVANLVVTNMGTTAYSTAPVVFGTAVTQYASGLAAVLGTRYVSGNNVYLCTVAGNFNATAPTSTNLQATFTTSGPTLLYIGTVGTLGTNLPFNGTLSLTTQYFHGGNVYQALAATAITVAANMPVHTSGVVNNLLYLGSVSKASVNFDATTGTVRSLNLTQAGSGFSTVPAIAFSAGAVGATGAGAAATVVYIQQVAGPASSLFQKSGGAATISGGLTINSDQNTSLATSNEQAASGVGALTTTNGGLNYTVAPTVGFGLPTGLNLIQNPGSGYVTTPTVTVSGGNLVAGTAITTSSFTIAVNAGKVQAVYLSTPGTAVYSTLPTLTLTTSPGVTATLAFPTGCLPVATANIGANRQLTSFTITNPGFGYVAAPTVGIGTTTATANGGTFTTVATAPTARIGLYNLTLNFFSPAASAVAQGEDAALPSNRKINTLTLAGNGNGLTVTSNLVLYGSSPLSLTASGNTPGNVIDLGGSNLLCTWNGYGGATSTFGTTNTFVKNGSMTLIGRGGPSSFNFPFSGTFNWSAGSTPTTNTTGSTVTRVTVTETAAPSNSTLGTGIALGARAFRVQYANIGTGIDAVLPTTSATPSVTMNFNSNDALTANTQDQLLISDSTSLTGPWNAKSVSSGSGAIISTTTGSRTTATTAPGPIAPTGDNYYAWSTSAPTITDVTPLTQCANSGTFTVTGTNLTGVSNVKIGGTAVTSFTIVSATSMTGVTGNGTTGFLSFTKNGQTITGTQTITVNPSPLAPAVNPVTSTTVNLGGSVTLQGQGSMSVGGTINYYSAAVGGTLLASLPDDGTTTFTYTACSSTTLYAAENSGGCDGPRTPVAITVNPTTITASIPTFCGTGGDTVLTATPSDASILYTWTSISGATISSTTGEVITATTPSSSDFSVTATKGSCSATASISVSVYPLPSATVTTTASGVCPGTSATINSGLSAGNFTSLAITSAPKTAPVTATTLVSANVFNVPLSSGTGDDGGWGSIPVGFNFNFFGTSYSTINIGTNGTLTFGTYNGTALADFTFTTLPSTSEPLNMVAVMAMDNDLRSADGGAIKYWTEGIAPNRKFVVSYEAVKEYGDTKYSTAQAIFYETIGVVEVHVTSSTNVDRNKLVGINNGTGTVGVLAYASGTTATTTPQNPITSPFAYRFSPPANYTVTWTAFDTVTNTTTTPVNAVTNAFSLSVNPSNTTIYTISYTNQTTLCTNALNSAQVTMQIISNTAPDALAVTSASSICLGNSVSLSLTNTSAGAYTNNIGTTESLTYQWQVSTDGGTTWTDISGATSATASVSPIVASQYRCNIKSCTQTVPTSSSPVSVGFTNSVDTTTPMNRCGDGTITISASTLTSGASIKWYTQASGGTAIATGGNFVVTGNDLTITNLTATTTYYAAAETTGPACSSARVAVIATRDVPFGFASTSHPSNAVSICSGDTVVVETNGADHYDVFSISPTTGVTIDQLTGFYTFNPSVTTTYTLSAAQSFGQLCANSFSFTVTVNSSNVTASASATPICIGSSTTLSAVSLGFGPQTAPTGYCVGGGGTTLIDEQIFGVSFGSLNNLTQGETCSSNYTDYTSLPATSVSVGASVPFSVVTDECDGATYFSNGMSIFIDYNRDGDFDDSGEQAYTTTTTTISPNTRSGNITIPLTASAGVTRMRVVVAESASSPGACTAFTYGEAEDYNINIVAPISGYTYAWSTVPASAFSSSLASLTVSPTETTVYRVTGTSPQGCTSSSDVTVTVNSDPVDVITGGDTSICLAGTAPDNDAQSPATIDFDTTTTGVTWSSSSTAVATIDAKGVLTPLTAGTTNVRAYI